MLVEAAKSVAIRVWTFRMLLDTAAECNCKLQNSLLDAAVHISSGRGTVHWRFIPTSSSPHNYKPTTNLRYALSNTPSCPCQLLASKTDDWLIDGASDNSERKFEVFVTQNLDTQDGSSQMSPTLFTYALIFISSRRRALFTAHWFFTYICSMAVIKAVKVRIKPKVIWAYPLHLFFFVCLATASCENCEHTSICLQSFTMQPWFISVRKYFLL